MQAIVRKLVVSLYKKTKQQNVYKFYCRRIDTKKLKNLVRLKF